MKMHLVDQSIEKNTTGANQSSELVKHAECLNSTITMLTSITEVACEHEADLDLMRLVNYIDLYRAYLTSTAARDESDELRHNVIDSVSVTLGSAAQNVRFKSPEPSSFDDFICDSRLLTIAAAIATTESGETVAVPVPLHLSANVNFDSMH